MLNHHTTVSTFNTLSRIPTGSAAVTDFTQIQNITDLKTLQLK